MWRSEERGGLEENPAVAPTLVVPTSSGSVSAWISLGARWRLTGPFDLRPLGSRASERPGQGIIRRRLGRLIVHLVPRSDASESPRSLAHVSVRSLQIPRPRAQHGRALALGLAEGK